VLVLAVVKMPVAAMMTVAIRTTMAMMDGETSAMRALSDGRCARPHSGCRHENARND
jgi:hypothetical protein